MTFRFYLLGTCLSLLPVCTIGQSLQLADSLRLKGEAFQENGHFKQAEFYYKESFRVYKQHKDTAKWLKTGKYYAEVLVYRSKYNQALSLFHLLQNTKHPANDNRYKARLESDLGWTFNHIGNQAKALEHFNKGLSLAKQENDSLLIATVHLNMGSVYSDQSAYSKSLEARKKALDYFQKLDNKQKIAITLNNIGLIYEKLLLYDRALDYYTRSLKIREKLGNVSLLATIYDNIAQVQQDLGNYDQALTAYQKSLAYRQKAGSPQRTASTLNDIGVLYNRLGNNQKALSYYRESLKIAKPIAPPSELAATYKNIGQRLWDIGQKKRAIEYFHTSLSLKKETGNSGLIATSLFDLLNIELDAGHYSEAYRFAREAWHIADSTQNYSLMSTANLQMGNIEKRQNNEHKALGYYQKAYAYSRFLTPGNRLHSLIQLSQMYDKMGSDSTLFYGKKAINIIETGRKKAGAITDMRSTYFKRYTDFYLDMASWTLKYNEGASQAYHYVESAKARSLADELGRASLRIDEGLPDNIRIERRQKQQAIDSLYSCLEKEKNLKKRQVTSHKIRDAEFNYAAFENELHDRYPQYKHLEPPKPISLEKAQSICDSQTALLEYAVNADNLIVFLITNDDVTSRQFPLKNLSRRAYQQSHDLTALVQNFKDAILAHAGKQELEFRSAPLYNLLVAPFERQLQNYHNLIIVPDGPLAYLPFEALMDNGQYLIQQFDIKYEPSATTLTLLKKPGGEHPRQLLAVAGSDLIRNEGGGPRLKKEYSALPSTLIEVDSIAAQFSSATILKEDQVTEHALKQYLNDQYRFIHLATHGFIDEEHPAQSGLALSNEEGREASSKEDGLLKSSEIYRLNLNSDMVVLSACNSGIGKMVRGEGMLGLQRSFFFAGASSVVISLWNVYDRSTAFFMNDFYKAILSEEKEDYSWISDFTHWIGWNKSLPFGEKARALRQAKLELIHHPLFSHPVYWAPFIFVGR